MTGYRMDCTIDTDGSIRCRLDLPPGTDLTQSTLCLSMLAPGAIATGATVTARLGGYIELAFPRTDITQCDFTLGFPPGMGAVNRAWLPLSAHMRNKDGTTDTVHRCWDSGPKHAPLEFSPPDGLGLLPIPKDWHPSGGAVLLDRVSPVAGPFSAQVSAAEQLATRLNLPPLTGKDGLLLRLTQDRQLPSGGYKLRISDSGLDVSASKKKGAFYALVSLIWLRAVHRGRVPCGTIVDAPRFGWRGQHLDCARHFFAVDSICRLLDLMALLKLNRFHWHFADDEAFRLDLPEHPGLAETTGWRGEGCLLPGLFGGGPGPAGGVYSTLDVTAILDRAASLHIDVLPEIEFPAHALCLAYNDPSLRDPNDTGAEVSVQGYSGNSLNPALDATWDFIEPLAQAVARRFPFAHLHLGGDELPDGCWSGSPAVNTLKDRHKLRSSQDVQGWALARLASGLRAKDITPCAWEESIGGCQGGIGHDAVIFSWTGQDAGVAAARRGHPVVMCPAQHVYLDMAPSNAGDDWGAAWAGFVSLADTVTWDPIPDDAPDIEDRILGVQGAFWSEFTTEDHQLDGMLVPRILGIATKAWSPRAAVCPKRLETLARSATPLLRQAVWLPD